MRVLTNAYPIERDGCKIKIQGPSPVRKRPRSPKGEGILRKEYLKLNVCFLHLCKIIIMAKTDKRIELYISKAAPFAQPILWHITELVHKACPDTEETFKWSFPCFMYKNNILCSMAAFKQHASFGFWLEAKMKDPNKVLSRGKARNSMGHLGQLKSLKDLPSDKIMLAYIKEAMALVDKGEKLIKDKPKPKTSLKIPAYLKTALSKNKKALNTFEGFSYSNKKEYVLWVTEAKTEETRSKRLKTAIEWMSEGKIRNWKYLKCK